MRCRFPASPHFMQMCWVVPDLHAAMRAWTQSAGVGPFFLFDAVTFEAPHYRGHPNDCPNITAAMAQAGDIQIELVSQRDDRPSFWRDVVPAGRTGLHHMAIYSHQYDADLTAYLTADVSVAFSGLMMGSRVCWLDTTTTLGFMIELIEANSVADAVFGQFRSAAQDWNGEDPVRTLG